MELYIILNYFILNTMYTFFCNIKINKYINHILNIIFLFGKISTKVDS